MMGIYEYIIVGLFVLGFTPITMALFAKAIGSKGSLIQLIKESYLALFNLFTKWDKK